MQCPELGSVRISEIASVRGRLGLPVERERHLTADKPLSAYAEAARRAGAIRT
ncbi:transposon protein [Aurantimonas sp. 22II-16-19i]|nr:transposon protein [Aurantimonas sp. 22II-16-19i]